MNLRRLILKNDGLVLYRRSTKQASFLEDVTGHSVYPPVYLHLIFEIWSVTRIFFQFRNIKFEKLKNQFDFEIDFGRLHRQ